MRRLYTREAYIELVNLIREKIPSVALSTDFIVGFCGETEEQFQDTLSLMELVKFDLAYLYAYSMRDKTHAYHNMQDNVTEEVKKRRLLDIIEVFKRNQLIKNKMEIGTYQLVLVEGNGKKPGQLFGKADSNKPCIFENVPIYDRIPQFLQEKSQDININEYMSKSTINTKDYIIVKINDVSYNALFATPICKTSIKDFNQISLGNPIINF